MFKQVNITVNQLIASDLFLGYHIANWNPRTNFFLIGKYKNTNIFNINYTYSLSKKLVFFLSDLFANKGHIWLVNENFLLFGKSVELRRLSTSFPEIAFLNSKWYKGMLSNYKYVAVVKPSKFPHSIFVPNMQNNHYVVNEAFLISVPSISLVDSLDNPSNVFLPIPGNSKSLKSLFFFYTIITKSLFYSRYVTSSKFLFSSVNFSLKHLGGRFLYNSFFENYFPFLKKRFLPESIVFFFKSNSFLKKKFKFLSKEKIHLASKMLLFKWKIQLLVLSSIFKNVLYLGLFKTIKFKKHMLIKDSQLFKTLIFILN